MMEKDKRCIKERRQNEIGKGRCLNSALRPARALPASEKAITGRELNNNEMYRIFKKRRNNEGRERIKKKRIFLRKNKCID